MAFYSICIPVYKNVQYVGRLLGSILEQSFTDFEVIITDDSPDNAIEIWLKAQYNDDRIHYYKNHVALGTPENWNEGIRHAKGEWIKLMHDDDWFASPDALQLFHDVATQQNLKFIFAAYEYVNLENHKRELMSLPGVRWKTVIKEPWALYARNIIGPPSVTLVHRSITELYDNRMKWLVDLDYYIRVLQQGAAMYIDKPLVNIGVSSSQVTNECQLNPNVEIPEGLLLYSKLPPHAERNALYFDAWWRLIRNLNIRDMDTFKRFSKGDIVPGFIQRIIKVQAQLPMAWLKIGPISKAFMGFHWLVNKAKLNS
ncbi:MAG TPA: glycosyltransferase [Phnomibacter sp.]|nr:glycosyltransferase [Phnomibacter sp.]